MLLDGDNDPDSGFPVRVDMLDVNGDGKDEALLAIMDNLGVGMGVSSWSIWVFDGTHLSKPIETADYGVLSFPICSPDGRDKFLLVGQWQEGRDPKRGSGLYFSACWFQFYQNDDRWLSNTYNRPAVYRRYLFGFERLRGEAIVGDKPQSWYRSNQTHVVIGPWNCNGQ